MPRYARGADEVEFGGGAHVVVAARFGAYFQRLAKDGLVGARVGPAGALVDENVPEELGVDGEGVAVVGQRGAVGLGGVEEADALSELG